MSAFPPLASVERERPADAGVAVMPETGLLRYPTEITYPRASYGLALAGQRAVF
jgi:hypothetical protein